MAFFLPPPATSRCPWPTPQLAQWSCSPAPSITLWWCLQLSCVTVKWKSPLNTSGYLAHWLFLCYWPAWLREIFTYEFLTWKAHVGALALVVKRRMTDLTFGLMPDIAQREVTPSSAPGVSNTQAGAAWWMNHTEILSLCLRLCSGSRARHFFRVRRCSEMPHHWHLYLQCRLGVFYMY